MGRTRVLLYVPNIVGYVRLLLLLGSLVLYDSPTHFLSLYIVSAILDGFDGFLARKLNQTSAFGAWFDVVIDLISRGALWCMVSKWGYIVMVVEWLTFVATHCRGPDWKIPNEDFPAICRMVMAKGFKTLMGTWAITGIFVLPMWLYGIQTGFLSKQIGLRTGYQISTLIFLVTGRLLALTTELFFIWRHIRDLLDEENKKKS